MTCKPFRFWWIALLLGSTSVSALEIGEMQVQSSLNQLFDARIPLPKLTPEELSKVSVKLAPAAIFKDFQLERTPALMNLAFSVEYNAEGQVYVKVVSSKPIQEPSLGLLLEFGWPRGKTYREFTVLLDPVQRRLAERPSDRSKTVLETPAAAPPPVAAAPIVPPPASAESLPTPVATAPMVPPPANAENLPTPVATAPMVPPPAENLPYERAEPVTTTTTAPVRVYRPGDVYGPIQAGERLLSIAVKVLPDPSITNHEMVTALFRANPDAFGKAGMSALKRGAMLRLPSFREIAESSGSAAARHLAEVAEIGNSSVTPPGPLVTEASPAKTEDKAPEVFSLEPPALLEPVATLPSTPNTQPDQRAPAVGWAAAPSVDLVAESTPASLEPVSVTPLLFLALSEMMVDSTRHNAASALSITPVTPVTPEASATAAPALLTTQEVSAPPSTPPEPASPGPAPTDALALPTTQQASAFLSVPLLALNSTAETRAEDLFTTLQAAALSSRSEMKNRDALVTADPPQEVENDSADLDREALAQQFIMAELPSSAFTHFASFAEMAAPSPLTVAPLSAPVPLSTPSPSPSLPPSPAEAAQTSSQAAPDAELDFDPTTATVAGIFITSPGILEYAQVALVSAVAASSKTTTPPSSPAVPSSTPSPPPATMDDKHYGPVAPNERLWKIATKVVPDPRISQQHMMKALFKVNPDAFSKANDMNSLKAGAILRIPTLAEIVQHSASKSAKRLLEEQQKQAKEAPTMDHAAETTTLVDD